MAGTFEQLRARTHGYTVTPAQYVRIAYAALIALTLIVLSGAAVRLTGSGLGCPTWPKCYGNVYPPLNSHAVIEFSNRVISVPVVIAAGLAWLGALRRRPYRRDLTRLGALLPLGVVAQAVLGGFTVKGALDYGWVMGHFALSMLILAAAALLLWRASHEPAEAPAAPEARGPTDRTVALSLRALAGLGAVTIFAGTAATAAGPNAGGSPGQRINRLSFDGRGTMDFVIHRHAEIALLFSLAAAGRRRPGPVRDAPADGAGLGARGTGLRRLAVRAVGRAGGGPPGGRSGRKRPREASGGLAQARRTAEVPRKLGLLGPLGAPIGAVTVLTSG
jgi:cytochrome c oxidase assembly protein subunit 15